MTRPFTIVSMCAWMLVAGTAAARPLVSDTEFTTMAKALGAAGISDGEGHKLEFIVKPEVTARFMDSVDVTAIGRVRWEGLDGIEPGAARNPARSTLSRRASAGRRAEFELRELYLEADVAGTFVTVGKQQIVWGKADGLKVLDVVNPQSFREFILDDFEASRIPLWAANVEIPVKFPTVLGGGDATLQLLWVPDPTAHDIPAADARYAFTSRQLVPPLPVGIPVTINSPQRPTNYLTDSDAGFRVSAFWAGWDVTLNYLYRYDDFPVLFRQIVGGSVFVTPKYRRTHLAGGTFSNAYGDLTVRGEFGYSTDKFFLTENPSDRDGVVEVGELGGVLGFDWYGFSETIVSFQVFESLTSKHRRGMIRDRAETSVSILLQREFMNDTLVAEMIAIQSVNNGDGVVRPKLSFEIRDDLKVWIGADIFHGRRDGVFGQFDQLDRLNIGVEIGF